VIWNVGKEVFGYSRVFRLELDENSRNSFYIVGKIYSTNTDISQCNVA